MSLSRAEPTRETAQDTNHHIRNWFIRRPGKRTPDQIIGSGRQYTSWVALDEVVASVLHALHIKSLTGPVNVVDPIAVTNAEFTKTLGHVLSRPAVFAVPAKALRFVLGEMADELILAIARVKPERLNQTGFVFGHSILEEASRHVLGRHELNSVPS